MISFDDVTITYDGAPGPTVRDIDLTIDEGELCLVIGPTGVGKSTLLGAVNGLVPHFTGGLLRGRVVVDGRDTRTHPPRQLADVVGVVGQDPLSGFVTDTVEEELAYTMEQLAVPPATMRKRVEETLDLLGIAELRARPLRALSGGQQQRVAIGAVLTAHPKVLVLDEPTSALDPTAAEEVLAAITRLVHDLGVTVVMAEHRLERAVQYADRILHLSGDGTVTSGAPADILATSAIAPPVVRLGRLAGWEPLPLSVRDARRRAAPLRDRLAGLDRTDWRPRPGAAGGPAGSTPAAVGTDVAGSQERHLRASSVAGAAGSGSDGPDARAAGERAGDARPTGVGSRTSNGSTAPPLSASRVTVRYGDVIAVREVSIDLQAGEVVALMGRNGSGKSSLLWALQGAGDRDGGSVVVAGLDPAEQSAASGRSLVGLVPQTPADLLYLPSVAAELADTDRDTSSPSGSTRALLDRLVPGVADDAHPRDLSEGQRLGLVLAIQLSASPPVLLLDEPTRGLDYGAKDRLAGVLAELADEGRAVVVSTHDVEFVAVAADRVVVMAEGELVADGPTDEVVVASPAFAPQVAKILAPERWLTPDEVGRALAGSIGDGALEHAPSPAPDAASEPPMSDQPATSDQPPTSDGPSAAPREEPAP